MAIERPNIEDFVDDTAPASFEDEMDLAVDSGSADEGADSSGGEDVGGDASRDERGRFAPAAETDAELDAELDDDAGLGAGESVSLRDELAARGVNLEGDDETVLNQMLEYVAQSQQEQTRWQQEQQRYQQQLQQYQQYVANLEQQRQWYAQQQYAAAQQQGAQQRREYQGRLSYLNKVPEFDPQWMQFLQRGEDGNLTVINGGDPQLPQKFLARQEWEKAALRAQLEDPVGFYEEAMLQSPRVQQWMQQAVMQYVQPLVQQQQIQVQQQLAYREQERVEATRITQDVQKFAQTPDGQFTTAGLIYLQAIQDIAVDPRFANQPVRVQHDLAMAKAAPFLQQAPAGQPAAAARQPAAAAKPANGQAKRINILKKAAAGTTGRGGSLPRAERGTPVRKSNLSLEQEMMRDQREAGLLA